MRRDRPNQPRERSDQRMQYFVVMIDYGRRGREAIVDPEITRREVVSRVASGEYGNISFIHEIADCAVEDVTADILAEAGKAAVERSRLAAAHLVDDGLRQCPPRASCPSARTSPAVLSSSAGRSRDRSCRRRIKVTVY